MILIERTYNTLPKISFNRTVQAHINTEAANVMSPPPEIHQYTHDMHAAEVITISSHWSNDVSPFYSYTIVTKSPTSAELHITPKNRHDSNRYHSILTPDGKIVSRRGRAMYKLGTSILNHEYEQLGIAVSTPQRGRRTHTEFALAATLSYAHYAFTQYRQRRPALTPQDISRVMDFLENTTI